MNLKLGLSRLALAVVTPLACLALLVGVPAYCVYLLLRWLWRGFRPPSRA